jgi:hypothetical protein
MKKEVQNQKAKRGPGRPRKNNKADAPIIGAAIGVTGADADKMKSIIENQNMDPELAKLADAFNNLKALEELAKELESREDKEACSCGGNCKCDEEKDMYFDIVSTICKHCEDAAVFERLISNPEYLEAFGRVIDAIEQAKADFEAEQSEEDEEYEDDEEITVETFSETPDSEIYRIIVTVENPSEETFEKLLELFPNK